MNPLPITTLVAGSFVFAITALALNVSRYRVGENGGGAPASGTPLYRANRLHLNNVEHGLPFVIAFALLELEGIGASWLWISAAAFALCRLSHGLGMVRLAPARAQLVGATATYLVLLAMSVAVLVRGLPHLG